MVIVRNKKRVSYTYELTLKVKGKSLYVVSIKHFNPTVHFCFAFHAHYFISHADLQTDAGEWTIQGDKKLVKGDIEVPEFSFGELDDLQVLLNIDFKHVLR